jgi:vesicle-fusing ATPase
MIDGVNSINNVLVIGMTNRKDMLDEALLRPGRLEVQVEISLPDEAGRVQIFRIHTKHLKENEALADDVNIEELAAKTKNYSGAEIAGVVRAAQSFAMTTRIEALHESEVKTRDIGDMKVEMSHFIKALEDVRPAFGVEESQLKNYIRNGIIPFGDGFTKVLDTCQKFLNQVRNSESTPLLSILLEGQTGSGLTALAAHLGVVSDFPYAKMITPEDLVGYSEGGKCSKITKIFDDAYKSPLSLIVLDNIERLLEYVRIGPRFSNQVLQTLLVLVKRIPPNRRSRIMIIGTTASGALLDDLSLREAFQVVVKAPLVHGSKDITRVFKELNCNIADKDLEMISNSIDFPMGIKKLLMVIEMASQTPGRLITYDEFMRCLTDYGL